MDLKNVPFFSISPNDLPRPWLKVIITNPHTGKSITVLGLIDTGADECAFPAGYAVVLGHDLSKGTTKTVGTGNGSTTAYSHTVKLEINGFQTDNALIDFMPNLNIPLLGVKSFLNKFLLEIDYPNQKFSLTQKIK